MRKSEYNSFIGYVNQLASLVGDESLTLEIEKFKADPTPASLSTLAAKMSLCPIDLWRRKIDEEVWLNQKLKKDYTSLKARYSQGQYSSSTSLKSILRQLQRYDLQTWVLNKLQIPVEFLDEHRPLSILAISDALKITANYLSVEECRDIGKRNCLAFMDKDFGKKVKDFRDVKSIYENFCQTIPLMEKNWDYKILKTSPTTMIFETKNSEVMQDYSHGENYSSDLTSAIRLAFIQQISTLSGKSEVNISPLSPLGPNGELQFEVSIENSKLLFFPERNQGRSPSDSPTGL